MLRVRAPKLSFERILFVPMTDICVQSYTKPVIILTVLFQMNSPRFKDDPYLKEFGLSLSDQFETVEVHTLDPPQLEYNCQVVSILECCKDICQRTGYYSS
ncbi:hypothetical protein L798_04877 [Zootermopsis nevadensis]|uniref:Uncharacterized protein n=1 Tax=Zootermopsis nevadensis TaxID=136037 RepID=A0A067QFI2_ZOONE|nr:hypothetical protein L798_04877 [Zootermopsis nevadensis]